LRVKAGRFPTKSSKSEFGQFQGVSLHEHNLSSFHRTETIKVRKMFYFFQKTQKFSKKGLGVSICTHMAHLKIWVAGSAVKMVKIWGLGQSPKVCLRGANTHPKPFLVQFYKIPCIRMLFLMI